MPLPPHQHPLDWYVIAELKGETTGFMSYTKSGWVCRLCSSDKLSSIDDHCRTREHVENHRRLERRREELTALIDMQEQILLQQKEDEQRELQRKKQEAKAALQASQRRKAEAKKEDKATVEKLVATERRSNLKENRDMRLVQAHRNALRQREVEDFSSSRDASTTSSNRVRRLRAQRLAAQNAKEEVEQVVPQEKLRHQKEEEKAEKRLKMLEITKKHLEKQRLEEIKAEKEREARMHAEEERLKNEMFDCFGCGNTPSSIWQESKKLICGGRDSSSFWLDRQFSE